MLRLEILVRLVRYFLEVVVEQHKMEIQVKLVVEPEALVVAEQVEIIHLQTV